MKLSATTLGCPAWDLDTLLARLVEYGYQGIDFRGLGMELDLPSLPAFTTGLNETLAKIHRAGLEVSGLSSGAFMFNADEAAWDKSLDEVRRYGDLARRMNAPRVRVFGGALKGTPRDEAIDVAARQIDELAHAAGPVTLCVETHDDWVNSDHLAAVLARVHAPNVRVLWDLHHPFRLNGESPAHTFANIGRWVDYTHIKDSRPTPGGFQYVLPGAGNVPLGEMIALLRQGGYEGWLVLEWEKRWKPDIAEPQEAFPAYANYLRRFL